MFQSIYAILLSFLICRGSSDIFSAQLKHLLCIHDPHNITIMTPKITSAYPISADHHGCLMFQRSERSRRSGRATQFSPPPLHDIPIINLSHHYFLKRDNTIDLRISIQFDSGVLTTY